MDPRIVRIAVTAEPADPFELSGLARDLATINVVALIGNEPNLEGSIQFDITLDAEPR